MQPTLVLAAFAVLTLAPAETQIHGLGRKGEPGVEWKSELVALAPYLGGPDRGVEWMRVRWKGNTAGDVRIEHVNLDDDSTKDLIGALTREYVQFPGDTLQKTCRMSNRRDKLLCLERVTDRALVVRQCCADSMVVYFKDGRPRQQIFLADVLKKALIEKGDVSTAEARTVGPTHTFDVDRPNVDEDGGDRDIKVIVVFEYEAERLAGTVDFGIVRMKLIEDENGDIERVEVMETAGGRAAFLGYRDIGTLSPRPEDSIYKVQYAIRADNDRPAGIQRAVDPKTGTPLLIYSHPIQFETMILTDPWMLDEVRILQRFGSPVVWEANSTNIIGYRHFGLNAEDGNFNDYVHGVWVTEYKSTKMGSVTVLANNIAGFAWIFEFAINIRPERRVDEIATSDALAFPTEYKKVKLDISINNAGAARPLEVGLYLVSSGKWATPSFTGLKVIDMAGNIVDRALTYNSSYVDGLYDPFTYIVEPSSSTLYA